MQSERSTVSFTPAAFLMTRLSCRWFRSLHSAVQENWYLQQKPRTETAPQSGDMGCLPAGPPAILHDVCRISLPVLLHFAVSTSAATRMFTFEGARMFLRSIGYLLTKAGHWEHFEVAHVLSLSLFVWPHAAFPRPCFLKVPFSSSLSQGNKRLHQREPAHPPNQPHIADLQNRGLAFRHTAHTYTHTYFHWGPLVELLAWPIYVN